MSELNKYDDIHSITALKLLKFLKSHTKDKSCPECDQDEMRITSVGFDLDPVDSLPLGMIHVESLPDKVGFFIQKKYFQVVCGHCGFTKFFDADIIRRIMIREESSGKVGDDGRK